LLLAACSSDGGAAPSPTPPPAIDSPAPTTITSPAATTESPTTTATPTTTAAPTTTIDPVAALQADVESAYRTIWDRAVLALQNPNDATLEADALELRAGSARDGLAERLEQLRSRGQAIRPNAALPAGFTIEVPAQRVTNSPDLAAILVCELDSWTLVEVGTGAGGSDTVVNDSIATYREQITMQLADGVWRALDVVRVGEWTGVESCPAA
jgi:hypothetical protein